MWEDICVPLGHMHVSIPRHKHIYVCMLLKTLLRSYAYSQIYISLRNAIVRKTAKYIVF